MRFRTKHNLLCLRKIPSRGKTNVPTFVIFLKQMHWPRIFFSFQHLSFSLSTLLGRFRTITCSYPTTITFYAKSLAGEETFRSSISYFPCANPCPKKLLFSWCHPTCLISFQQILICLRKYRKINSVGVLQPA